jgi:hypothetical protein
MVPWNGGDHHAMVAAMQGPRIAMIAAAVAAVLLVLGTVPRWWRSDSTGGQDASLGPRGLVSGDRSLSMSELAKARPDGPSHLSTLAVWGGLGVAALLLASAGMAQVQRPTRSVVGWAVILAVFAALAAILMIFVGVMTYRDLRDITWSGSMGPGMPLFVAGCVAAFVASLLTIFRLPTLPAEPWPHREF